MKYLLKDTATVGAGAQTRMAYKGNNTAIVQVDPGAATVYSVRLQGRLNDTLPWSETGTVLTEADASLQSLAVPWLLRAVVDSTNAPLTVAIQE